MARSSFSVRKVCQILCGDDGDEEYVFSGSDDDMGMDDLDDDDISGDDDDLSGDDDSSFEVHDTGLPFLTMGPLSSQARHRVPVMCRRVHFQD